MPVNPYLLLFRIQLGNHLVQKVNPHFAYSLSFLHVLCVSFLLILLLLFKFDRPQLLDPKLLEDKVHQVLFVSIHV